MAVAGSSKPARENEEEEVPSSPNPAEATSAGSKDADEDVEEAAAAAAAAAVDLEELVGGDADIAYEQELRRDPYQLKVWLAYLKSRAKARPAIRCVFLRCMDSYAHCIYMLFYEGR